MDVRDKKAQNIVESMKAIQELINLLEDRISEMHKVDGLQSERHAFCYYRSYLWKVERLLNKELAKNDH